MKATTAKFERKGQKPRYIPNAANYNGYLVGVRKIGVGELYIYEQLYKAFKKM